MYRDRFISLFYISKRNITTHRRTYYIRSFGPRAKENNRMIDRRSHKEFGIIKCTLLRRACKTYRNSNVLRTCVGLIGWREWAAEGGGRDDDDDDDEKRGAVLEHRKQE